MPSKYGPLALRLTTFLLLLVFLWALYLTAFNYWAAGGPPTPHPEIYRMRGNIFFGIACVLFVAFAVCLWSLVRRKKGQPPAQWV
jgi:hypothetical protein